MATLLHQCSEVLHTIFQYVEPTDLAPLSRSCKAFHRFIESDQLLWKNQFLGRFVIIRQPRLGWAAELICTGRAIIIVVIIIGKA